MLVKELIDRLSKCDPDAIAVVKGFETVHSSEVAKIDLVNPCLTLPGKAGDREAFYGDRVAVDKDGEPSVWIGWSGDYRGVIP